PRRLASAVSRLAILAAAGLLLWAVAAPAEVVPQQQTPTPQPTVTSRGVPVWARPPSQPTPQQAPAPQASPVIARVEGRDITQAEFDRVAQPYFQMLRAQLGPSFAGDMLTMASFNVLDELIRRALLAIETARRRVPVSDADVDAFLRQDPFFLTDGKFDQA